MCEAGSVLENTALSGEILEAVVEAAASDCITWCGLVQSLALMCVSYSPAS